MSSAFQSPAKKCYSHRKICIFTLNYKLSLDFNKVHNFIRLGLGGLLLLGIIYSCATPTTPTGGPRDEQGPDIVRTEPETGTVNFEGQSITLHFSEFVNRSSLTQAIIVEPDIGVDYELDWGRKSVKVQFESELPELTTLILTIGTELSDMNGNDMSNPKKIAVSTGPEIDEGEIVGRVINAETGEAFETGRVLLYRTPVDLAERANYTASTDTGGTVQFSYLREGKYKAFWVDDRNRNKIWEPERERAQPFNKEFFQLEKAGSDTMGTVYVTSVDTTRPRLQGVGLFSSRRMRLRFSEDIQLTDSTEINVADSTGNFQMNASPLYVSPTDHFVLFAQSETNLDPEETYSVQISDLYDLNDNPLEEDGITFTGSVQEDTTSQRIIEVPNDNGLFPNNPLEVIYAAPVTESEIGDSLKIVEGDTTIEKWPDLETRLNKLLIHPQDEWQEAVDYEFRIWNPIREDYQRVSPVIWSGAQLGEIEVSLADTTREGNYHLQLITEAGEVAREVTFETETIIEKLPPQTYTVIVFDDQNENGVWDYGSVDPFVSPEPYFIQSSVPVSRGMTAELSILFENRQMPAADNE